MLAFFKTLGLGVLYTVLSPFILLLLVLYTLYCTVVFLIQLVRNIVVFFSGGTVGGDLAEDVAAKKILLERKGIKKEEPAPVTNTVNTTSTTNNIYIVSGDKKIETLSTYIQAKIKITEVPPEMRALTTLLFIAVVVAVVLVSVYRNYQARKVMRFRREQ